MDGYGGYGGLWRFMFVKGVTSKHTISLATLPVIEHRAIHVHADIHTRPHACLCEIVCMEIFNSVRTNTYLIAEQPSGSWGFKQPEWISLAGLMSLLLNWSFDQLWCFDGCLELQGSSGWFWQICRLLQTRKGTDWPQAQAWQPFPPGLALTQVRHRHMAMLLGARPLKEHTSVQQYEARRG